MTDRQMHLPDDLNEALKQLFASIPEVSLTRAAVDLSNRYRSPNRSSITDFMTSDAHRLAYLAVRLPATFAAVRRVLRESVRRLPSFSPTTICDIGAGPGTASWAVVDFFASQESSAEIRRVTLHEKDAWWQQTGRQLMRSATSQALRNADWRITDLTQDGAFESNDLMILSYVVGELSTQSLQSLMDRAWAATNQVIAVIEPGTPHGFEKIRMIRDWLLTKGAFLVAPCPHHKVCPMATGDWCHFSERVERSALHRKVKDVDMGYEDEKFSYIVASKEPVVLPSARILRHPQHHSGHVDFVLCGQTGLEKKIISKKLGEVYKQARKLEWGDSLG